MSARPRRPSRLDAFCFAPVDARIAGAFRIGLAAMVALVFWPERHEWLVSSVREIDWIADLFRALFLTDGWWALTVAALVPFAAGHRPGTAGALVALLLVPRLFLWGRVPSHQILLLSLLAFSLLRSDAALALPWRRRPAAASAGPLWPIRLIQLQLSLTYGVNALAKTTPAYLSGDVLTSFVGVQPNLLVDLSDGFLHVGPVAVPIWLCAVGTAATEYALALGFWFRRTRIATTLLGVGFHGALNWVIAIGWLDWVCLFLYLAFLLPFELREPRGSCRRR